ncbi:AfsR/SARP family transcriptional regulator [Plantactinospora sp. WMMC1484]|uniref:AfsR/SARP family transcriptional regulator n=1 Tax=Plantactinospora sp. WMMC1484 TaxID=3404122 RepID=UPI003BF53E54
MPDRLWFTLLGPVTARRGRVEVDLGSPQQRAVLAVLLLQPGLQVPIQHLVNALWEADAPRSAEATVRTYVYRLRRALAAGGEQRHLIRSVGAGYAIDVLPDELDLATFRRLMASAEEARRAPDLAGAADLLRRGLALWNGQPLAGLPGRHTEANRSNLGRLRLTALEALLAIEIDLGAYVSAADQLASLVAEHPLDERFRRLLMLVLYRSGQQAEALGVYQEARDVLAAELGVDPGPQLQALHLQILRADPVPAPAVPRPAVPRPAVPAVPAPPARPPAEQRAPAEQGALAEEEPLARTVPVSAVVTPAQLPADLPDFTGRGAELAELDALLPAEGRVSPAMIITTIHGMAGTGKTALAVHWAHRIARRFPDGQIYLNLRGFHPSGTAMEPLEALRAVFDALGVGLGQLPVGLDAQAARYRSLLAGRRLLIVLDNARDADQVRPLLPGAPGCLVIVTSRYQLSSLVTIEHARPVALDVLADGDARRYLTGRLGRRAGTATRHDIDAIVGRCGRLPLALSIVAARTVLNPQWSVAAVADQLGADHGTLDSFADIDPAIDLGSIFSWSYERLSPPAARTLRLLALHPGPDTTLAAVASLAGVPVRQARGLAEELVQASLTREHGAGRYLLHDLVRAYAGEIGHRHDPEGERCAGLGRMLDHYIHTAHQAVRLLGPQWELDPLPPPPDGVALAHLRDADSARGWLAAEHHALVAAVQLAAEHSLDAQVWRLAATLSDIFQRHGHWRDQVTVQLLALRAGRRLGDLDVQAAAQRSLGSAYARLDRPEEARASLAEALVLFDGLGDRRNQGRTHRILAYLHGQEGGYELALRESRRAMELYRISEDRAGTASALNDCGWCHAMLGNHHEALAACRRALRLFQEMGNADGEASTWDSLGFINASLGDRPAAVDAYHRALEIFRRRGDRYNEAETLAHLGDCHHAAGDASAAVGVWRQALEILERLGHPLGRQVRARLQEVERFLARAA